MAKRMMMEQDEQGWSYTDKFVCTACVDDYALEDAIVSVESTDETCSFCARSPAASLDVLMDVFVAGLRNEYNDADAEFVPYETKEGGYQFFAGPGLDSWDLVGRFEDVLLGEGLVDEVRNSIHDTTWVERDSVWRRRDDVLRDAWSAFSESVKYRTRYVIWLVDDVDEQELRGYGEVPPGKIIHDIGQLLEQLGMVRVLPAASAVWRAQTHEGSVLQPAASAGRLGTGKREHAKQPNRMSPAGIPMFYGAMDLDTAIVEVAVHAAADRDHVTVGRFSLSSDVTVVDFTALPTTPSVFDPRLGRFRREITFLHEFVKTLSIPVAPGDEAIDYVPTQVLTEYFLRVFKPAENQDVIGLVYPSAPRPGGVSLVLDISNERCFDDSATVPHHPSLVLDAATVSTFALPR
jgi:hypothetical protein